MKERGPIFYDAERVRWRRTRRVMEITGALLTVLLAYFFVTIAVSVELPAGLLPGTKPGYRAVKSKKKPVPTREGRRRRADHLGLRTRPKRHQGHTRPSHLDSERRQAPPMDEVAQSARRAAHDGPHQQLRRRGMAHQGNGADVGERNVAAESGPQYRRVRCRIPPGGHRRRS